MTLEHLQIGLKATFAVFAFAFGACAGSLINVLVYRLPRGQDVVWQGSRCPACATPLTWRENIPVFGWLGLAGRCRFCKSKISAEYPLVEALVGLLWAAMFVVYYALPEHARFCGVDWSLIRPQWAVADASLDGWPRTTWPIFVVHLFAVASLVAMTLVDAKTFTIPLALPWAAMLVGIAFHTIGALLTQCSNLAVLRSHASGASWAIATPDWLSISHGSGGTWWWIGAAIGGTIGLVISNVLLHLGLIRPSFADYAVWERSTLTAQGIDADASSGEEQPDPGVPVGEHVGPGVRLVLVFTGAWLATILLLGVAGWYLGSGLEYPRWSGLAIGTLLGPFVAAIACRLAAPAATATVPAVAESAPDTPHAPDLWIAYPHARREMLKEVLFLTPGMALGWGGGTIAQTLWATHVPSLWLTVLCGTLMGALIGGGAVWAIRILGSLAFGKEAMGLGDVHMMAGVGACLGWIDATLAVPLAAVVGLWFVFVSLLAGRPAGRAMPFGPYLAIATVLIMFGKSLVEIGLTRLVGQPINLP